ncbi:mannosylphosphorylation protein [Colletotrichum kahawae]|uniref:Mannosylphosphorylation protein n=1 Tax=Colletotrichum kahawae TaxID=34407 RepID=A0AAE0D366_COLKA|nr:mannosylphosphorylation protein [Colletotrichum kahawae]
MHFGRLFTTIGLGAALVQATPIQDQISKATAATPRSAPPDQPVKHFHEAKLTPHYSFSEHSDPRFASAPLNETAQRAAVKVLVQTYLSTVRDLGVQTWLSHNALLGWWWNKQVLPWDAQPTVQLSENGIRFLAAYYNMTTWYYKYPGVPGGREFQLEVNPNFVHGAVDDEAANTIDARWIDMENGLFIDIRAVRYVKDHPEGENVLASKDGHEFRDTYLYPLLETTFEGVRTKIPYQYKSMLVAEYGEDVLINKEIKNHKFVDNDMEWVPNEEL